MLHSSLYQPPCLSIWQGRRDISGSPHYLYQVIRALDLSKEENPLNGIALLGFASDEGVIRNQGRAGAKDGPLAIKKALAQCPLHTDKIIYDAGEIVVKNGDLKSAQNELGEAVAILLRLGLFPIILGGGHETAWGHYQGIEKHLTKAQLNIINFDAHFDIRDIPKDEIGTSGTPFQQIAQRRLGQKLNFDYHCIGIQEFSNTKALFDAAKTLNINYVLASEIYQGTLIVDKLIDEIIRQDIPIYLSLCLDVLGAGYAPGVSAPQALGLTPWQLIPSLKKLARCNRLLSVDIVELNPHFDIDNHTAKLAAQLLALFL